MALVLQIKKKYIIKSPLVNVLFTIGNYMHDTSVCEITGPDKKMR